MSKLVDISITNYGAETIYTVGPLRFADVMANEELKRAAGLAKRAVAVDPGGYTEDDEGKPLQVTADTITDYQALVVSVICGTVRKVNGEERHLTEADINEMDLQEVLVLFNAVQHVIKPQEGGRQAVTFQVLTGSDGDVGEGVHTVRDDAKQVHSDA